MATLKHGRIIKGFEGLCEKNNATDFFIGFLKTFDFPASTIRNIQDPKNSRNIAISEGDFGLAKNMYFRSVPEGMDVNAAVQSLVKDPVIQKNKVRFVMATDFKRMVAYDTLVDDWADFDFCDLPGNYEFFLPITGLYEKPLAYAAHPADVKACEKMGKLYDVIKTLNHFDDSNLHHLNVFLTRLLFCFFAEDTGIFPKKGQMTEAIASLTLPDGSDIPSFFERLFWILDMEPNRIARKSETAMMAAFPYVNGGLFREKIQIPKFNAKARNILLECGRLEWNQISPVIFGAMFQSVMNPESRHDLGAHYTSEKNIMKVIKPLFLDDLREELDGLLALSRDRKKKLQEFQRKLASLKFLDPACGSGNFLVVAFRELKRLELDAVTAINSSSTERSVLDDWKADVSQVSIQQFYGIEIEELPVEIARVSMWLMEHVMNLEFGKFFGAVFPSIPLRDTAHIVCANAMTTDWENVVPVSELSFIMGNPPFNGAATMSKAQKNEVMTVFDGIKNAGILDYVTAWYKKAADFLQANDKTQCAFVSTNSISQGEQVAPLWGSLFKAGVHINFAHQTFQWKNEAKNNAGVYCVVVGFSKLDSKSKKLFCYETPRSEPTTVDVKWLNGYLIEANPGVYVESTANVINGAIAMVRGNQPTDGGNLIIEAIDYEAMASNLEIKPYIKKLVGSKELLHNIPRYCLWLHNAPLEVLSNPLISPRIQACKEMRLASPKAATRLSARTPHLFQDSRFTTIPNSSIVVPTVSSERRNYIPMEFIGNDTIVTNLCFIVPNGTLYDFGILESRMHMTWMRTVCGRLESRYRYSRDLCYNTFPWPDAKEIQQQRIEILAQKVLDARDLYPELTLADLYDPDKMPPELRDAHNNLDQAVDQLYRPKAFENDEERLQMLFERYEVLIKKIEEENDSKKRSKQ